MLGGVVGDCKQGAEWDLGPPCLSPALLCQQPGLCNPWKGLETSFLDKSISSRKKKCPQTLKYIGPLVERKLGTFFPTLLEAHQRITPPQVQSLQSAFSTLLLNRIRQLRNWVMLGKPHHVGHGPKQNRKEKTYRKQKCCKQQRKCVFWKKLR